MSRYIQNVKQRVTKTQTDILLTRTDLQIEGVGHFGESNSPILGLALSLQFLHDLTREIAHFSRIDFFQRPYKEDTNFTKSRERTRMSCKQEY